MQDKIRNRKDLRLGFHYKITEHMIVDILVCMILSTSVHDCLYVQEFNPEKYNHLADIFGHAYLGSGTPVAIVHVQFTWSI